MATRERVGRVVTDRDMRDALAGRLAAWTSLDSWRRPICSFPPEVRRAIDAASDRIAACRARLVAGLWQRRGRWSDPANRVEMILDADGDGYLLLAPGVLRPGILRIRIAELANSRRFGGEVTPRPRSGLTDAKV